MRARAVKVITIGLVLVWCPPIALTQPAAKVPKLGVLTPGRCPQDHPVPNLVMVDLETRGYVLGRSILVECRFSDTLDPTLFRRLASELVDQNVDVILTVSSTATQAARFTTSTIPVVALDLETDPIASGLATSLARPSANITGVFLDAQELNGKWFELLKGVVPRLCRVAAVWEATMDQAPLNETKAVAKSLGIQLEVLAIRSPGEIEGALRGAKKNRVDAVVLMQSPLTDVHGTQVAALALKDHLPTIAMFPTFPSQGGLMSYGPDVRQLYTLAASFIDRILKGAKPGQVPIERPTHFYLAVNRKVARELGLTISPSLLVRANEVIDQ